MALPAVLVVVGLAVAYVVSVWPAASRRRREGDPAGEPFAPRTPLYDMPSPEGGVAAPGVPDPFDFPDMPDLPDVPSAD